MWCVSRERLMDLIHDYRFNSCGFTSLSNTFCFYEWLSNLSIYNAFLKYWVENIKEELKEWQINKISYNGSIVTSIRTNYERKIKGKCKSQIIKTCDKSKYFLRVFLLLVFVEMFLILHSWQRHIFQAGWYRRNSLLSSERLVSSTISHWRENQMKIHFLSI